MDDTVAMIRSEYSCKIVEGWEWFKTIAINLAGIKANAKWYVRVNKTAKALKEIAGIDVLKEETGELKICLVNREIASKWRVFGREEQV